MSNILGLHGISFNSGAEKLIAVWHKSPMFIGSSYHEKTGPSLTDGLDAYFDNFLNSAYMVNGTDGNFQYNGGDWLNISNLYDSPIAQFIKLGTDTRLYLYKIKIAGVSYPSRVWFSDLPKGGNNRYTITWGLETGNDLVQTAGSAVVTSAGSSFVARNIKVGDPLIITSGNNQGEYTVQSIDNDRQITLTSNLGVSQTGSSFWVGSNWFDVNTDDGDIGNGLALVSNELLCFKKKSVHRYNSLSKTLRKVKNAPGTTSPRSIVEGSDGQTYWYHPTGIYRTQGINGQGIDAAIEDIVDAITSANQSKVCGWEEDGKKIVFAIGDVTLRDGDSITNCEIVFDEDTQNWEIRSRDRQILVATKFLTSTGEKIYGGDSSDSVFELNTGNSFSASSSTAIPFALVLHPVYPAGSEAIVDFTRVRLYVDNGLDVQIFFKRIYYPTAREDQWYTDNDWTSMKGSQRGTRSEWYFPRDTRASGIQLKIVESSTNESFLIKKIVLYYQNEANR